MQRNLLEDDSDEEEDFFLVQTQVDEVIDVMQENITKVIERGERLDDLQDKSDSTARVKLISTRQYCESEAHLYHSIVRVKLISTRQYCESEAHLYQTVL
ncbi:Vesicle-associated membrane protein 4 [Acipenser ruthenus]|uniref:Vesicle-associated membrane protein 4 n=1 Tax=Acipenser ruthenus TaxID=7906 RepID=A0A444UU58_ACIRT|nr:Vesicle-associated membrane protein 4 [Acipenser ruthenus]